MRGCRSLRTDARVRGFTLIELVMVIVIGGILAIVSVQFIVNAVQGTQDTAARQQLATNVALVAERISREVRQALPNSVRVFDPDGDGINECVEFVPVKEAGRYLQAVAGTTVTAFTVVNPGNVAGHVAIYPTTSGVIYPAGTSQAVTPGEINFSTCAVTGDTLTCSTYAGSGALAQQFPADSPQRRFFVTDLPVAFCRASIGGKAYLLRYHDYGFTTTPGSALSLTTCPAATCDVMTRRVSTLSFSYSPASLSRAAVVSFLVEMSNSAGEILALNQQVQVRNVP